MGLLALCALAFWAVHAVHHLRHRTAHDLLWMCNVAALAVAVGLCAGWPTVVGVGVLWLALGLPIWVIDLAGGGELLPTSIFTHVGVLAVGLAGLARLGLPAHTWWKALVALTALHVVSRRLTPRRANVNVAFAVWPGSERLAGTHARYVVVLAVVFSGCFFALETLLGMVCAS